MATRIEYKINCEDYTCSGDEPRAADIKFRMVVTNGFVTVVDEHEDDIEKAVILSYKLPKNVHYMTLALEVGQ